MYPRLRPGLLSPKLGIVFQTNRTSKATPSAWKAVPNEERVTRHVVSGIRNQYQPAWKAVPNEERVTGHVVSGIRNQHQPAWKAVPNEERVTGHAVSGIRNQYQPAWKAVLYTINL